MIKLAYDISSLNHLEISGVGVYVAELLKCLRQIENLQVAPVWRISRFKHRKYFQMHAGDSRPWLNGWTINPQVLHGPDFRVQAHPRAARVVTIHDVAFLKSGMTSPEFAAKKKRDLESLLLKSPPQAIAVVSEATKRELVANYPEFEPRTFVTYLGADHFQFSQEPKPKAESAEKYFLFVGNLEARKNVLGIIKAFEIHAAHSSIPSRLKLIGKLGYQGEEIISAVENSRVRSQIDLLGYCSKHQLELYYRNAIALVYPSWIEGFGLPVIEAMKLNCPVITSSTTSTAEVSGGHAFLVDPSEPITIASAMDRALALDTSPEERERWLAKARLHADSFTWARCASSTYEIYRYALKS